MAVKKAQKDKLTIAQIRELAAKSKPDKAKFRRAMEHSEKCVQAGSFEWNRSKSTVDGLEIHYFRIRGESITGILCPGESELWAGTTYRIVLDDDTILRIPGNRQLKRIIKAADCVYQRVTITYLGKRWLASRHYEKTYQLDAAPLGKAGVGKAGREILAKTAAEAKRVLKSGKSSVESG